MPGLRYRELPKYVIDYVFCGRWSATERKAVAAFVYGNNVSLCINICMYIYTHTHTYIYIYIYVCVCVCVCVCVHIFTCI